MSQTTIRNTFLILLPKILAGKKNICNRRDLTVYFLFLEKQFLFQNLVLDINFVKLGKVKNINIGTLNVTSFEWLIIQFNH